MTELHYGDNQYDWKDYFSLHKEIKYGRNHKNYTQKYF